MPRRRSKEGISKAVEDNQTRVRDVLGTSPDVVCRLFGVGPRGRVRVLLVAIEGLYDPVFVSEQVVAPIQACGRETFLTRTNAFKHIAQALVSASDLQETASFDEAVDAVLSGNAVLFVEGSDHALIVPAADPPHRAIEQPGAETVVRGPKEGFNEVLQTTGALLRRRIRSGSLRFERLAIGTLSRTPVEIAYIEGVVDPDVLREVRERLSRISIDAVLDTGYLEEFVSDQPYTLYPTVISTQRPDKVAGELLDGKVAIAADGSSEVIVVPVSFWDFLISSEDYYHTPLIATFIRWMRLIAFTLALVLPAFYVALTTFHQEMLPTSLALRIAAGREGTPFPAVVEALLLEIQFEVLREAGLRIPQKIGTAVSIVGVLVLGQALVAAGVVSPILIIVVGSTAVASFAVPLFEISGPARLLRFPLMLLAGSAGVWGITLGLMLILAHLCTLRSFDRPYLAPLAPFRWREMQDSMIVRVPWWAQRRRPQSARRSNRRRQPAGQAPGRDERVW